MRVKGIGAGRICREALVSVRSQVFGDLAAISAGTANAINGVNLQEFHFAPRTIFQYSPAMACRSCFLPLSQ